MGGAPTSVCHFFHPSVRPSIHPAAYLRNRTSSNYSLVHMSKVMMPPGVFFIFLKFSFFGLLGVWKGKKLPKMKSNNCIHHTPYLKNSIVYNHFFKTLILWVVKGSVKGQKMVQNEKKICLLCSISQESYIIWFLFMGLVWNDDVYRSFFHFFKILIFGIIKGVKR